MIQRKDNFHLLLNHAQLTETHKEHFQGAELEKVEVSRNEQEWTFYINLPKCLPSPIIKELRTGVITSFKHIAKVKFVFRVSEASLQAVLTEYWDLLFEEIQSIPSLYNFLKQAEWELKDRQVMIKAPNSAIIETLERRKIAAILNEAVREWTEEKITISFLATEITDSFQKFKQEIEEEDYSYAMEAVVNLPYVEEAEKLPVGESQIIYGKKIKEHSRLIKEVIEEEKNVCIQGSVFSLEQRELKNGRPLIMFNLTDFSDSLQIKVFVRDAKKELPSLKQIKNGSWLKVRGDISFDTFSRELVLLANDLNQLEVEVKADQAKEKRVELHLHSNMSAMDGINSIKKMVEQASIWGHSAIAITDHGVVQAFPDAYEAGQKHGVKIIYGVEANVVDDGVPIVHNEQPRDLASETYVVFDTETTGLSAVFNTIIEIGAVKIQDGKVIDRFSSFIDPQVPLPRKITEITGITDSMVKGQPLAQEVLPRFRDFIADSTLVAHNARFDMGFLNMGLKKIDEKQLTNPVIDTVELARFLYPTLKNHKLDTLCKAFNIELNNHHRADNDAEATGKLYWKMAGDLLAREITNLANINQSNGRGDYRRLRPFHLTILVKNELGLKNLYKIISLAHIDYYYRNPRIPKSILTKHREGLLFGTACSQGELFDAMLSKTPEEIEEVCKYYDYLEIQPPSNYQQLLKNGILQQEADIINIHQKIIAMGKKLAIPVVATGDVHYLDPKDEIHRKILVFNQISGFRYHQPDSLTPAHFRTTEEMLASFPYFDEVTKKEVVVDNPHKIIADIESLKPFPDDLFAPVIEGADEEVRNMSYATAREIYGDPLPELVEKRLEKELNGIINNGFAVIYLISHKLVNKSLEDGYLVGSRGSVGSSFVATMTKITEVNPLPPHYVCPSCKHSEFITDGSVGSGFDLPDRGCPKCQTIMIKDGHDIPFETFMGFDGDKVPDIDLNFSGEYQPVVHKYTEELFGEEYVYRAGTISTVAEKTAYGYVRKYLEEHNLTARNAEINRLVQGCTGIKRTTGQHPGGLMVIPQYKEVYDFTPIQRPADDTSTATKTTHFDYHAISGRLLKLDILGHDDPTAIRMLQDLTGIDPKTIPTDDPKVYELFRSTEPLGITPEQLGSNLGVLGIPEFGTKFVRQMLEDTKPSTFAELVRISGLSHGTDVWLNNAQEIIRSGQAVLNQVICTRDDIMGYLIQKGLEPAVAFKLSEKVRKGKGLDPDDIAVMKKHAVPDWYIESCQKIKYMFPKAHAVAYVLMAIRIAYFKVHYPIYYYATYFTVRADEFDLKIMTGGAFAIKEKIAEIMEKGVTASPKEKGLLTVLEICLEMVERGYSFRNIDLYQSDASKVLISDDQKSLIPPLSALAGIGINAAKNLVEARSQGEFLSVEDIQSRAKASKTVIELLQEHGCLEGLPETNQLTLF